MKKISLGILFFISLWGSQLYAAEFEGVGGLPAHPDPDDPRTKDWFIYTLEPGERREDELLVVNNSGTEARVILYPADSTPSTDGGFALKQQVEPRIGIGNWITLSKAELTLPAYGSERVPFLIAVPNDPALDVGEHTGGILIQKADQEEGTGGGITLRTRVGVRVYVTIPGEIIKKLEIERFTVEYTPEKELYTAILTVKNSGNVSQNITVKVRVRQLWPWLEKIQFLERWLFPDFPIENSRDLQVLRGDALTSNFEFAKPLFGKLRVEASVESLDEGKPLVARAVDLDVPFDRDLRNLLLLGLAFVVSVLALIALRRAERRKKLHPDSAGAKSADPKKNLKKR